ncbi:ExbD/TolR family protein [Salipiger bermudensis]|uniref:ExbD/TolR family protein n=1 Tax=Salipiger bermudensis TaxID=344736 RepID=UPI001CD1E590|nr:biopolymer transporter ExbD [Salipiger bermudensis]MCA1286853.1 biopolymer transporter ExbD [Salipiger bermudensis]
MRKARRRRRLSMTSLIDVIFLLLLFFMLTSTFTRFSEVELTAAGSATPPQAPTEAPLFLRLGAETAQLNNVELPLEGLAEALAEARGEGDAPRQLLVAMRPDVSAQRLTDLLVVLRGVTGISPTILGAS